MVLLYAIRYTIHLSILPPRRSMEKYETTPALMVVYPAAIISHMDTKACVCI